MSLFMIRDCLSIRSGPSLEPLQMVYVAVHAVEKELWKSNALTAIKGTTYNLLLPMMVIFAYSMRQMEAFISVTAMLIITMYKHSCL